MPEIVINRIDRPAVKVNASSYSSLREEINKFPGVTTDITIMGNIAGKMEKIEDETAFQEFIRGWRTKYSLYLFEKKAATGGSRKKTSRKKASRKKVAAGSKKTSRKKVSRKKTSRK